ncbi:MAG: class I SAM-dependent methyltransferase, partial [Actinomycetota bacterium]|nr:class I SAM-dependent methyltransferase [Actinomycetota bacterium]
PWAFFAVPLCPTMRLVDLGGALSGLQFVLARSGATVINVDPFIDYGTSGEYAGADPDHRLQHLNQTFATAVQLRRSTLAEAELEADSVDVVYCISTIEHLPAAAVATTAAEIRMVLRPGGHAVLSIDLFLDLWPFTALTHNRWGTNIDVAALVEASGLELVFGTPSELLGFAEFDAETVQANVPDYLVGDYPALAQCFVLRKAERRA